MTIMNTTINPGLNIGSMAGVAAASTESPVATKPKREAVSADKRGWWWGVGRRKTAVARIRLRPAKGDGSLTVFGQTKEGRPAEKYFTEARDQTDARLPLKLTGTDGKFEIVAKCNGGGTMGQAQAIRLGIARALMNYDPNFEAVLRENGLLTRDSRKVERKKYGQAGARRRFQFSKR